MAVLEMTLPPGQEQDTISRLLGMLDSTRVLPGCTGGGVFRSAGHPDSAIYIETWERTTELEAHVRSRDYELLLAIMETAPERPTLTFRFLAETRGLEWVKQLRLGGRRS